MKKYSDYLEAILYNGYTVPPAREKMPSVQMLPTHQMTFEFSYGLPILTGKYMPFYSILGELICFIQGKTDVRDYAKMGCNVWWDNAYKWNIPEDLRKVITIEDYKANTMGHSDGFYNIGRIYAAQWRDYVGLNKDGDRTHTDQLVEMVHNMKYKPYSRYHVMSAWNPGELSATSQPNCHVYFQASIAPRPANWDVYNEYRNFLDDDTVNKLTDRERPSIKNILFTHLTQRSCDAFLGVPFNITSYSIFSIILGILTNSLPIQFDWVGVNNHIYSNHVDAVTTYLDSDQYALPKLSIDIDRMDTLQKLEAINTLDDLKGIFKIVEYKSGPKIPAPLSVGL